MTPCIFGIPLIPALFVRILMTSYGHCSILIVASQWHVDKFTVTPQWHGGMFTMTSQWYSRMPIVTSQWYGGTFTVTSQCYSGMPIVTSQWYGGTFTVTSQWHGSMLIMTSQWHCDMLIVTSLMTVMQSPAVVCGIVMVIPLFKYWLAQRQRVPHHIPNHFKHVGALRCVMCALEKVEIIDLKVNITNNLYDKKKFQPFWENNFCEPPLEWYGSLQSFYHSWHSAITTHLPILSTLNQVYKTYPF